ncbi:MAG: DUF348 domain-containing protein [Clostridium sp.]|nr:DUF348 domain-containing protein [Clostridium sp.]
MLSFVRNMKKYILSRTAAVISTAVFIVLTFWIVSTFQKEVTLDLDGEQFVIRTLNHTVCEVLGQSGIQLGEQDYISVPLDAKLKHGENNIINIRRAVPITVIVDGNQTEILTSKERIGEALGEEPVNFSSPDKIRGAKPSDAVIEGMRVEVIKVDRKFESQNEIIPCDTVETANNSMDMGESRVVYDGEDGVRKKIYMVEYENGKEVKRELKENNMVSEPKDRIVEFGTIPNYTTSRGERFRYKEVKEMRATSYTACFEDTGKSPGHPEFGITYTGMKVKKGVIAVDPRVIPLGTRVYIEGVGDVPDYGYAIAADIGSAVKGDIIDLYMEDKETVRRWGVRKVKVYILYD